MTDVIAVYLELGAKKAFASALDWPGWSRGGRGEEAALEALVAYAARYARVADRAGLEFTPPTDVSALEIVERIAGNATTEFGVPALPARDDSRELDDQELVRQRRLLQPAW